MAVGYDWLPHVADVRYDDTNVAGIRDYATTLQKAAAAVRDGGANAATDWAPMTTYLQGDFVGMFLARMADVKTRSEAFADDLEKVASALSRFADDIADPVGTLWMLRGSIADWRVHEPVGTFLLPADASQEEYWMAMGQTMGYGQRWWSYDPLQAWISEGNSLKTKLDGAIADYESAAYACARRIQAIDPGSSPIGGTGKAPTLPTSEPWKPNMVKPTVDSPLGRFKDGYRILDNKRWEWDPATGTLKQHGSTPSEARPSHVDHWDGVNVSLINVSKGGTVGAEDSTGVQYFGTPDGWHGQGSASYWAGLHGQGSANANIKDGRLTAGVSGELAFAVHGEAQGSADYGVFHGQGQVQATAGAWAAADASVSIGKGGVTAKVGFEAMAGAEASASASGGIDGAQVGVKGTVYAGIGAKGKVDASLTGGHVKMDVDVGLALGVGGGVKFSVDIEPKKLVDTIKGWFT